MAFAIYTLYYGPALVIDNIGFNIYVSSFVVQVSEIIVYFPLYYYIEKIPRKMAGVILFSISGISASILLFFVKPKDCDFCFEAIIELIIIAIFRTSISIYFIINYIYLVEVYPTRARALGCGVASAFGTLGSTVSPIMLGLFQRNELNVNIVFAILAFLGVGIVTLLPETLGKPLED